MGETCDGNKDTPGESGGELAALAEVVLHPLSPPAEVICGGTKGAVILGGAPTAAAGQTVDPGEEGLLEPLEQLQHQEVFYSKFTLYKEPTSVHGMKQRFDPNSEQSAFK